MNDQYTEAADFLAVEKLTLAAANLQHLLKIQNEQATLDNIVQSLQQTIIDAHGNNPSDLCDKMMTQSTILDGLFHYYIDKSKDAYTADDKIAQAFRANQQTVRTALAWKKLKTETYIKQKLVKRTVQDAALDT